MSGKREIHGVSMIPFGLAAGFVDGQEIRITKLAESGFCFRTVDKIGEVEKFRVCFFDGLKCSEAAGNETRKNCDWYTEVTIDRFEIEVRVDDELGISVYVYSVFVDQEEYRDCARNLILWYDRFVRLKLECEDGELAEALTGYPAEEDEKFAGDFEEQKKLWFGEEKDGEKGKNCIAAENPENEGRSENNIELAVELDRPELYERYLSMKFCDFMDWYWKMNRAEKMGKGILILERIYVGNAFCHLLFPKKELLFKILEKAESEELAVTLTSSYLREFMVEPVEKLLDELVEWCKIRKTSLEIAANDWGMLELLRDRKEFLVPCMGTLLNKRKKDPRMGYKQGDIGLFRENSLNAEFYRTYLRDTFGIQRYEWESCGYQQDIPEGKNSIHVPFYQTNTSQYCTLYAVCKNGERGKQELPKRCLGYCRDKIFLYPKHLKMVGRYNSLFALDERAVFSMADSETWKKQGIDRIVVNLL